jgi:hypothetical protein
MLEVSITSFLLDVRLTDEQHVREYIEMNLFLLVVLENGGPFL